MTLVFVYGTYDRSVPWTGETHREVVLTTD